MESMLQRIQNERRHFCTHPSFTFMRVWKCNERARPRLSDGRQKTQFPMPYLKAQWLGQFFSLGIFKAAVRHTHSSPKNVGIHHHPQADGRKPVPQFNTQLTWPHREAHPAATWLPSQGTTANFVQPTQDQTSCHSTDAEPFSFVFTSFPIACLVVISSHA